jgi:hypothetical protein
VSGTENHVSAGTVASAWDRTIGQRLLDRQQMSKGGGAEAKS